MVEDPPGPSGVLGPPAVGGAQTPGQHRPVLGHRHGDGVVRDEPDQLADGVQEIVRGQAGDGGAAQLGECGGRAGGLLPAQDRFQQFDGDDVGEPGHRHFGHFLGCAPHIQGGADPQPGVVEQLQAFTRHFGAAGEGLELRGVPECHHAAGRSVRCGEPLVDGEQPVGRQVHLVGGRPVGGQQPGELLLQAELGDLAPLGVRRQVQQAPCLVVGQQQPAVTTDDQHSFPHRVQHRVVVLVHAGHLGRPEAMGLAPQPPADQARSACRDGERGDGAAEEDRHLLVHPVPHRLDRDGHGDDGDDGAVGPPDGNRRDHGEPQGPLEGTRERLAGRRLRVRTDDVFPDLVRVAVGEGDPVQPVHDDGVDACGFPGGLGMRLEYGGRVRAFQRRRGPRGVRERLRRGERPLPGVRHDVAPRLCHQGHQGGRDEQHDDRQLQEEDLPGEAVHAQQRARPPLLSHLTGAIGSMSPPGRIGHIAPFLTRSSAHTPFLSFLSGRPLCGLDRPAHTQAVAIAPSIPRAAGSRPTRPAGVVVDRLLSHARDPHDRPARQSVP